MILASTLMFMDTNKAEVLPTHLQLIAKEELKSGMQVITPRLKKNVLLFASLNLQTSLRWILMELAIVSATQELVLTQAL
jgi:hypothetical protein